MPRGLVDTSGDPFPVKTESPIMRVHFHGVRIWLPVHKQGSAFLRRGPLPRTIVCFLLMRTHVSRRMRILSGLDSDPQPLFVSGRGS
ncbi:hypothetical protein B296_00056979 [Ensete ventricosum]|uniref:Uncharacterized protein n=1 Tax=Ensete ventricosum TaxID=4639 RepID=A0A426XT48_ENSVE|nr:hypothetical protein B296_00056979 [Ensete ventricosum]